MSMKGHKFHHDKFTALCVLLNSEGHMSVTEFDEYIGLIYLAQQKLLWMSEKKGCTSCMFYTRGCEKAEGKIPPEHVQRSGCEMYENKHQIPW